MVWSGFNGFYNGFQWLHDEKKPGAGKKFGNLFFCAPEARKKFSEDFLIFFRESPKKNLVTRHMITSHFILVVYPTWEYG